MKCTRELLLLECLNSGISAKSLVNDSASGYSVVVILLPTPQSLHMLSVPRISTYSIHNSYVSFYIAAALFNGFLLLYFMLWSYASGVQLLVCLLYTSASLSY
jgi:hypothetical protein